MKRHKNLALVAHDNRKRDLIEWIKWNFSEVASHRLICTGTTGRLIEEAISEKLADHNRGNKMPEIVKLRSGPLGGDQQLGALIAEGEIDILIFFWDPMQPQPHDVDVKALLRIAVVYNLPVANNRATADFLISSPLFAGEYEAIKKDYSEYIRRKVL
jgi:methylglyoxal synthase